MASSQDIVSVPQMFDHISPSYDALNRVLSCGLDLYWRWRLSSFVPKKHSLYLLDGATGTGDQLISVMKNCKNIVQAAGIDLSSKMLALAEEKTRKKSYGHKLLFKQASLLDLPFPDNTFDCVTLSFGIRNVGDVRGALKEIRRVLKKEGVVLILEFSLPSHVWLKKAHLFYLSQILPRVGGFFSKNPGAYDYLHRTILSFPYGEQFCAYLKESGFQNVKARPLTAGIVTLYQGSVMYGPTGEKWG